ncbi:hypothetical protein KY5_3940c [Streptomyces formicae]|uniref:Uncharacterized protein n=2 Tax=Streptomyces formicae TaxID=1616117 RepID=A0A291QBL2_9ACTN|nr:hypothetical protein KY5_3940c [Streptomyces formicae]
MRGVRGPQEIGTIGAEVRDGSVGRALVSTEADGGSGSPLPDATALDRDQVAAPPTRCSHSSHS